MKLRRNHFQAELISSPLNDIMFFLLLFFLILSTVASPHAIKVLLPKADPSHAAVKQPLTITVTEDKRYFLNDREFGFDELEPELVATLSADNANDATIVLRPSRSLSIQDLVDVLQIGVRNDLRMVLATTTGENGKGHGTDGSF